MGLASALLATRPKEKALEACALLSPLGAARRMAVVKKQGRERGKGERG